jgi:tetratricopeptide (TPR) repeat protein
MGLCNCEHLLGNLLQARDYCRRALNYDPNEPLAYFFLGDVYVSQFNALLISDQCPAASASQCREYLLSARANYKKVVEINPDLEQARLSRGYIESIEGTLPLVGPKSGH